MTDIFSLELRSDLDHVAVVCKRSDHHPLEDCQLWSKCFTKYRLSKIVSPNTNVFRESRPVHVFDV